MSINLIDADGHLEESPATFSDAYLDPVYRNERPKVVNIDGMIYWTLEEQLFPRRLGKGCHNLGTPASFNGQPSPDAKKKIDTIPSMELSDISERLRLMDEEEILVQVIYPTLFLAYPLTTNVGLMNALCSSYNRFLGDRLSKHERLKWAAVANLDDVAGAAKEVRKPSISAHRRSWFSARRAITCSIIHGFCHFTRPLPRKISLWRFMSVGPVPR